MWLRPLSSHFTGSTLVVQVYSLQRLNCKGSPRCRDHGNKLGDLINYVNYMDGVTRFLRLLPIYRLELHEVSDPFAVVGATRARRMRNLRERANRMAIRQ